MFDIAFLLVTLHGVDGREVDVNAGEITSFHCKLPGTENKMFVEGVNTIINLTDGKYVSVRETCSEVRDILRGEKK